MSMNRPISLASLVLPDLRGLAGPGPTSIGPALAGLVSGERAAVVLDRIPGSYRLFLEELIRRDRDDHFPGLRIDEIRQREDHAVNHPGDDRDNSQKAEQTGHRRASEEQINHLFVGDTGRWTTTM